MWVSSSPKTLKSWQLKLWIFKTKAQSHKRLSKCAQATVNPQKSTCQFALNWMINHESPTFLPFYSRFLYSKSSTYNLCDLEESWVLSFLDWCFPWHFQLAKGATQGGSSSTASLTSLCSQWLLLLVVSLQAAGPVIGVSWDNPLYI